MICRTKDFIISKMGVRLDLKRTFRINEKNEQKKIEITIMNI